MIALAIESSNQRGMGHLFHSLLYVDYLKQHNVPYRYFINKDSVSEEILMSHSIQYDVVDYADVVSNWEADFIHR